jgi:hypothetical protein
MKGIAFYADLPRTEYDPDTSGFPRGRLPKDVTRARLKLIADSGTSVNVIAVLLGKEHRAYDRRAQEAFAATFGHPDSDTSLTQVDFGYLRNCRRISENLARQLHPRLFARLDSEEA